MKVKKIRQIIIASILLLFITNISPSISFSVATPLFTVEAATTVKLNKTKATLIKGQGLQLTISGTKDKIQWSSSNRKIASVSSKGKVTAREKGTTIITAKVGNHKYNCEISVETPKISKTSITMYENKTYTLKLSGTKQKITWKSSKTSVASVNSNGKIFAKQAGTTTITATVLGKTYSCKVTVKKSKVPVAKTPVCVSQQTMYAVGSFGGPWASGNDMSILDIPECFIYIKDLAVDATVTDVKSSNPNMKASKRSDIDAIEVAATNRGTHLLGMSSTISFKVTQNGKTYDLSCLINVKQKMSPMVSFKIGSQDITKYFNGYTYVSGLDFEGKQTVSVKMASGYVLDFLHILLYENGEDKNLTIKNGSSVDFDKCKQVTIFYHTNQKPANYTASTKWYGIVESPLHNYCTLILE